MAYTVVVPNLALNPVIRQRSTAPVPPDVRALVPVA